MPGHQINEFTFANIAASEFREQPIVSSSHNQYQSADGQLYSMLGHIIGPLDMTIFPEDFQNDFGVMFECERNDPLRFVRLIFAGADNLFRTTNWQQNYYYITQAEYYEDINAYIVLPGQYELTAGPSLDPPRTIARTVFITDIAVIQSITFTGHGSYTINLLSETSGAQYFYNGPVEIAAVVSEDNTPCSIRQLNNGDRVQLSGYLYHNSIEFREQPVIKLLTPQITVDPIGVAVNSLNLLEDLKEDLTEVLSTLKAPKNTKDKLNIILDNLTVVITSEGNLKTKNKKAKKIPRIIDAIAGVEPAYGIHDGIQRPGDSSAYIPLSWQGLAVQPPRDSSAEPQTIDPFYLDIDNNTVTGTDASTITEENLLSTYLGETYWAGQHAPIIPSNTYIIGQDGGTNETDNRR